MESNQQVNNTQPVNEQQKNDNKVFKILSYIGILWLIGLFVNDAKKDPETRFHVGQGIILSIVGYGAPIVISLAFGIVSFILNITGAWTVGIIVTAISSILSGIVGLGGFVLAIIGIVNAANDKQEPLPLIGKFAFYK